MIADLMINLAGEFAAAQAALPAFADRIRPRCSPAIWDAQLLGVLAVEFDRAGGWRPWAHPNHVTGGTLSLIVACRAVDDQDDDITHPNPRWCALQAPDLVDIVAMPLAAPHRWARRTGLARTLGRVPFLEPRAVVRIYRSPTSWLSGDGAGISILERERGAVAAVLRACSNGIEADDAAHAREIFNAMAQTTGTPRIFLAGRRAASVGAAA